MDSQYSKHGKASQNIESTDWVDSLKDQSGSIGGRPTTSNSTAGGSFVSSSVNSLLKVVLERLKTKSERLELMLKEMEMEHDKKLFALAQKEKQLKSQHEQSMDELKALSRDLVNLTDKCNEQLADITKLLQDKPISALNALPDLPLRIIFSKLFFQEVLQMGNVCLMWKSYQEDILSKVHSIALLIGRPVTEQVLYSPYNYRPHLAQLVHDDGTLMYPKGQLDDKWFQVDYSSLPLGSIPILTETMPNLAHLQMTLNEVSYEEIEKVIEFGELWFSTLTTLKLWCNFSEGDCEQLTLKVLKLLNWINILPALEHLTLELQHNLYPTSGDAVRVVGLRLFGVEPHFELPILSRLHQFYFSSLDYIERTPLLFSLMRYVPSNRHLTQIQIGNMSYGRSYSRFTQLCPTVAARITSLPNDDWIGDLATVGPIASRTIISHYSSLTELYFVHRPVMFTFTQLINNFSTLTNLVRLHLNLHFDPNENENMEALNLFSHDDQIPRSRISQLASVKLLVLEVNPNQQSDLDSAHWEWAFPNVQMLELMTDQVAHIRRMLRTVLRCPKLVRIFTFTDNVWSEWTVVEADGQKDIRIF